ncbi:voltage-dependent calcium channel subunit alpha-2/delta-2-like isoform X2 [Thrips palmi]|uniref:Voltage-dependent calcium channel subunit alpha-2/delta-2-like isoform X2 n=1 Tax=Thrips palmi TaxID=161013 RepID=A0A6P8YR70_THRPL|nr:voltage-dependent calcium channel subunit alpha-2/delta-2-like isoform X2 [Thrips palmi]
MGPNEMWNVVTCLIIIGSKYVSCDNPLPDLETLSQLSSNLEKNLMASLSHILKTSTAVEAYSSARNMDLVSVNGTKVIDEVISKANEFLGKKEQALQRLYDAAKDAEESYEEDLTLTLRRVQFFNVKGTEAEEDGALIYAPTFGQNVSLNSSGVHIPLEIFEGYPEILNGLRWSAALDRVFTKNFEEDPTLRWQYFGSARGFMRIYPALRWPENLNPPDLYDVRRRPWYIHSISSPKDIIILIDKSGSVHGQTIDIMKIAVKALIKTLSEDDYVNVAWFNNEVNWVVPCLDSLVPATSQNKRVLLDAVDRLHESNLTSYETALEFAYDAFQRFSESREPWEGANCHKAIMFFSDGGTEWPHELSAHLCNESTEDCVRVFTFGCGPHPIPTVILKSMACKTRGYFSSITALGAIQNRIQDYVRVLGRPLVLSDEGTKDLFHWHNVYIDKGGLGPVVTVTLPVGSTSYDVRDPLLLGVVGTDIPTSDLEDLYPKNLLGAFGYPYAINNNGFIVFHPQLHHHMSYLQGEDPPNIDLTEAEGSDWVILEAMREAMVRGHSGHATHEKAIIPVGQGRAVLVSMNHFYGALKTSNFRMGLALPLGHATINVQNVPLKVDHLAGLRNLPGSLLAPWKFCSEIENSLDSQELIEVLLMSLTEKQHKCNVGMLRHLLMDMDKTRALISEWEKTSPEVQNIRSRFFSTEGGLTVVHPVSRLADYEGNRNPHKNHQYLRALARDHCVFTPSQRDGEDNTQINLLSIACPVQFQKGNSVIKVGVAGVELDQSMAQTEFNRILQFYCADNETLHCYMLDDNGFIVSSNLPRIQAGDFIGQVDPQLAGSLIDGGFYRHQERFNLQAWCLRGASEPTQSASRLTTPFLFLIKNIWSALSSFHVIIHSIISWTRPAPVESFYGWELIRRNYSCITKASWLVMSNSLSRPMDHHFRCGDCSRIIYANPMNLLSAVLVVSEPPCDCAEPAFPISFFPQEDAGPDYCSRQKVVRERKHRCYSYTKNENGTTCYPGDFPKDGVSAPRISWVLLWTMICFLKAFS